MSSRDKIGKGIGSGNSSTHGGSSKKQDITKITGYEGVPERYRSRVDYPIPGPRHERVLTGAELKYLSTINRK